MPAQFFERPFPSANTTLLDGPRPILVDTGDGSALRDLRAWLGPRRPVLVVNTHWHSDHAGGNAALGLPIAASAGEAGPINAGSPDAGRVRWLAQEMAPYRVARTLEPGEVLDTGAHRWTVLALPGHTAGHLGFYAAEAGILVSGDALHDKDVGWLDLDAHPESLVWTEDTLDRIASLAPRTILPGHGPAVQDVPAALARAMQRVASWRERPERIAWHACKRIFAHALIVAGGVERRDLAPMLAAAPWVQDHARRAFGLSTEAFIPVLIDEMTRSGAARWTDERLMP